MNLCASVVDALANKSVQSGAGAVDHPPNSLTHRLGAAMYRRLYFLRRDHVANVASAEKRNRQRIKRRARNQFHLSTMRTYVKRVRTALESKDSTKVKDLLKSAV